MFLWAKHVRRSYWFLNSAILLVAICCVNPCLAESLRLESPSRNIMLDLVVDEAGFLSYSVSYLNRPLVAQSDLSFDLANGATIGKNLQLLSSDETNHHTSWQPVYGERSIIEDHYNQLVLTLHDKQTGYDLEVTFRCYDPGVAFQTVLSRPGQDSIEIAEEHTEFRFHSDHEAWVTRNAQGLYEKLPLSALGKNAERPLVVRVGDEAYVAIAEAKLVDYARMLLSQTTDGYGVRSQLSGSVKALLPLETPWRVIMIGQSPGELLENNDILLNLNEPCAIADTSWIKPGKVLRDITLTTEGGKACIDFAVKYNLQYVEFDAGWYGHEYDDASDATTITVDKKRTHGPLDLHYLIDYARERGIGVILYVNRRALEKQLDEILPLYKSWGVAGVKYGFVRVGSQEWTSWLHEAVRKAADHELMVDVHDEYRPTGYQRTYPNWMTAEGCRGDEATPSTEQTLTSLFTRTLAGASDFKICYFNERVNEHWSHAHQLAKAMCFYDPWQFLFWYDTPLTAGKHKEGKDTIVETPELEFWRQMPTVWDDTKVIHGEIGEYAVIARRSGAEWFVGALNSSEPRTLRVPLDFLDSSHGYTAHIYSDDPSVDTVTQVRVTEQAVNAETTLEVHLLANGGQAIHIEPGE